MRLSTILLALFTLVAFAANSILCRQALTSGSIGPVEFTSIRLGSGLLALSPIILLRKRQFGSIPVAAAGESNPLRIQRSSIWPATALFGYAVFFSLAYIQLDAGIGALILFASVQITMIGVSIARGNKVTLFEWAGLVISFSGLIYLLLPGLSAPPALGAVLMMVSGMSWGMYSLLGKAQARPILSTARNFLFCLPGVMILGLVTIGNSVRLGHIPATTEGILLAVISGAVASAMGYILWYMTMRRITTTVASVSQLVVPILAAMGGVLFLHESLSLRLMIASGLIIGGIVITIVSRKIPEQLPEQSQA
jgi:drug/metabolite transporter (DMT)-like permease